MHEQLEELIDTAVVTVTWPDHTKTQPDDGHLEDPNPSNTRQIAF